MAGVQVCPKLVLLSKSDHIPKSQTTTVDRQMRRYNVPRISFINKMDRLVALHDSLTYIIMMSRPGANPWRIVNQIRTKLRMPAAAVHVPIGIEDEFKGVVDLVHWRAIYNQGPKGSVLKTRRGCISDM